MSSRAIRALRGDDHLLKKHASEVDESHDDDEEEEEPQTKPSKTFAFATMLDDSSSEEDDDDDDDDDNEESDDESNQSDEKQAIKDTNVASALKPVSIMEHVNEKQEEEDIDTILHEFHERDALKGVQYKQDSSVINYFRIILEGLDTRDLDVDYTMRTSLLGAADTQNDAAPRRRAHKHTFLFGSPREGTVKPPRFVGGGMGMASYDRDETEIPSLYRNDDIVGLLNGDSPVCDESQWYRFLFSDDYRKLCDDYKTIQQSGDLNALIMFVAHHPFVTDALLQLSLVLYQTNRSQEGLTLLRRCLWVYESSALSSFTRDLDRGAFMDYYLEENTTFFEALFRLQHICCITGLSRTAMAAGRLLLSLDPLRDPMGILLILDSHALACNSETIDTWIVNLVESERIFVVHREDSVDETFSCNLTMMPNWAFSYALALFRQSCASPADELCQKAKNALIDAISIYPSVVEMILQDLNIDTTGRSFRRDWISVLNFTSERSNILRRQWMKSSTHDPMLLSATLQSIELITKIFVRSNAKFWSDEDVEQWIFDTLSEMKACPPSLPDPPSLALTRYGSFDPVEFEHRIQLFPPDANIIDPGLINYAMEIDPNRPRFLRGVQRGRAGDLADNGLFAATGPPLLGPPANVIDPDWPLAEVFLRSILPWNRVDGVPPPRR